MLVDVMYNLQGIDQGSAGRHGTHKELSCDMIPYKLDVESSYNLNMWTKEGNDPCLQSFLSKRNATYTCEEFTKSIEELTKASIVQAEHIENIYSEISIMIERIDDVISSIEKKQQIANEKYKEFKKKKKSKKSKVKK